MKLTTSSRPRSIATFAIFELMGSLGCLVLLPFTVPGSRDFIALLIGALLGFVVVYGLWTVKYWAYWATVAYECSEVLYEAFLLSQPEYRSLIHMFGPIFGILMSALALGYLFLDRSIKPVFNRTAIS
ncbi:hypothetical protein KDW_03500 [Dictyobacter vulcani]|uniref:Uncharacterized protein n=1 Tax=Dictyobacter vulcani TaxID=2607529 RepID=A0A5J4KBZ2_9CHLR|nr:hypothetical protein [Dictyobacter vulcani]GER86188.1 hypothetical protein KDW_03500 [Dictyobacter vulcani]